MVKPGQTWENGKTVVKLQEAENGEKLLAITFAIGYQGHLLFSHANVFDASAALDYLLSLGCQLTDKVLALAV